MDGILPLLLVIGLLVAALVALGFYAWRRSARSSSFSSGATTEAEASPLPAEGLAAEVASAGTTSIRRDTGLREIPESVLGAAANVPVAIHGGDAKATNSSPSSGLPPEILPIQEDVTKEQTEHARIAVPDSPLVPSLAALSVTVTIDAGSSPGSSDSAPSADVALAPQHSTRAVRDGDENPMQYSGDATQAEDDTSIRNAAEPEPGNDPSIGGPPNLVHELDAEIASKVRPTCATHLSLPAHTAEADQCEAALDPDSAAEVAESESPTFDDLEEIGLEKPHQNGRKADPEPFVQPAIDEPVSSAITRPRKNAVHRDRRGGRRASPAENALPETASADPAPAARPAAEAKLRLSLHPIRRTVRLSVVLTRSEGFPERATLQALNGHSVEAYDARRYDDLDIPWTSDLLSGELRLASTDGCRWVRSARQIHIFAADPNEPDLVSVGAARPGVTHALVCRSSDAGHVRLVAASAGSPDLNSHEYWQGIPDGWTVLSGYTPTHAAGLAPPAGLRPIDPGEDIEILFEAGLAIRPRVYVDGHPPRILVNPAGAASITIGGRQATLSAGGTWEAPGWDAPGQHIVDVVPGPSASYEIVRDPWVTDGWDFWNAHSGRFESQPPGPWTRTEICGAQIRGPAGEIVLAAETQPMLIALGPRSGAALLQPRGDVSASIACMAEAPAFLIAAKGQRRTQGRVIWLGLTGAAQGSRRHDPDWVAAVRTASSRRLLLDRSDAIGEDLWRKAKDRARRLNRQRA